MRQCSVIFPTTRLWSCWPPLGPQSSWSSNTTRPPLPSSSNSSGGQLGCYQSVRRRDISFLWRKSRSSRENSLKSLKSLVIPYLPSSQLCKESSEHFLSCRFIPEYEPASEEPAVSVSESVPNSSDDDVLPFQPPQTSQVVPDSPCSVNSDCSGSWIGIPRWENENEKAFPRVENNEITVKLIKT